MVTVNRARPSAIRSPSSCSIACARSSAAVIVGRGLSVESGSAIVAPSARCSASSASMRAGSSSSSRCSRYERFFRASCARGGTVRAPPARDRWRPLAQPILVAAEVLLHPAVSFEHQRAGHDVVEKRAVVADQQQRARPLDELRFEQLQRFEVEVVGRFVQHEQVGRPREQPGEQQAVALAARQRLDRRCARSARKQEVAQVGVDVARSAVRRSGVVAVADRVEHGPLRDRAARAAGRSRRPPRSRRAGPRPGRAPARRAAAAAASSCRCRSARSGRCDRRA